MPNATIFRKMRETKDGKKLFPTFFGYLTNKETGERDCFTIKFTNEVKEKLNAVEFPITANIHGNTSVESYTDSDGVDGARTVLWITDIGDIKPFVDDSLSQYE